MLHYFKTFYILFFIEQVFSHIEEASEALLNAKYIRKVGGKQYKAIGKTKAGRCLAVFYKYYQAIAEITTARDVDIKERRRC